MFKHALAGLVCGGITMAMASISGAAEISGPVPFGKIADGTDVAVYTLTSKGGVTAKVMTLGATLLELHAPDKAGKIADVVLGFDNVAGYESDDNQYFGATVGRVANRIAKGKFTLDGKQYSVATNNGPNHLHGGVKRSLDKVVWTAAIVKGKLGPVLRLRYSSPDGEEGYPGKLDIEATYQLTDKDELVLSYKAVTDKATPINLANHSYFNLAGAGADTVLNHELTVAADQYTPVDDTLIPTGLLAPVAGTPFDFKQPHVIGERIGVLEKTPAMGYDHNLVLTRSFAAPTFAAKLRDPQSGRVLTVSTTQPGVQVYSGNFLKDQKGRDGKTYKQRTRHVPGNAALPRFDQSAVIPVGRPATG